MITATPPLLQLRMRSRLLQACVAISLGDIIKKWWLVQWVDKREKMQIFVQGQQLHTVNVCEETTIEDLKGFLAEVWAFNNFGVMGVPLSLGWGYPIGWTSDFVWRCTTWRWTMCYGGGSHFGYSLCHC